jgi:uncharacterized membrane protein (DUF4010 family)
MLNQTLNLPSAEWPYVQILIRLALSLALGLLIGLERERRGKEAGLRTFGFICLLGAMGGTLGVAFSLMIMALVGVLVVLLNVQTLRANQGTELTTSAAMLITCMSGILCGQGHTISPAATMVGVTALLAWKEGLAGFTTGLSEKELRSAIMLAILAIVIYPALPVGAVGPWNLLEPRAAWVAVILIAGIGFVNYILWKIYGTRGTELSGFLGGLINSNFTVIEMCSRLKQDSTQFIDSAYRGILLATTAMVMRNAGILLILAPLALIGSVPAFLLMMASSLILVLWNYRQRNRQLLEEAPDINFDLPFSLPLALRYGAVFLVLHVIGGLTQRYFGDVGFYVVSVVGGLLSSASAVAAAATLASQGHLSPTVAGNGAVIASFTSLAFSLSFVLRSRNRALIGRLSMAIICVALAGLIGLVVSDTLHPFVSNWLPQLEGRALN